MVQWDLIVVVFVKNKSPFEKEAEIHEKILGIVQNSNGMTTTELQRASKVSRKTLEKHLSLLVFENEMHMSQYGPTRVYYPNKKIKNFKSEKAEIGNRVYYFDLLENQYGRFYLIQEKRKGGKGLQTKGAILVPEKDINVFAKAVNNILRQ